MRHASRIGLAGLCMAMGLAATPAAHAGGNVTAVLESEVVFLDPHSTTATITRTFGYMVYDTLFSMDSKGIIHPQMVDTYKVSDDKLTYDFTLRDGLKFHDGADVTSADVIASLKRWGRKDTLGRMLFAKVASLEANGPKSFTLKLKEPFALVIDALGKPNALTPFIMPERFASLPDDQKIPQVIGSGPFIFRPELWRTGDSMVVDRNPAYIPRKEPADFLAGGKDVKIDRLTMKVIPDSSTAAQALVNGEIDYFQFVPFDWVDRLKKTPHVKLMSLAGLDMYQGNFRLNQASPPFNDPAVRQVLWKLVDQKTMLDAIGIAPELRVDNCPSFWMCGTPYETKVGSEVAKFSLEDAKAALAKTGYKGEKVVFLDIANNTNSQPPTAVLAENMKKIGFNVDVQVMDWGTVLQRRAKKDGWSLFAVFSNGIDMYSPLTHFYVASNCVDYAGWSCDARATPLLAQMVQADGLQARKDIAANIQSIMYENVPSVMWGQFSIPAGYRDSLVNPIQSSFPIFWQVDKTGK